MATGISDQDIDNAVPNKGSSTPDPNSEQPSRKLLNALLKNTLNDPRVTLGRDASAEGNNSIAMGHGASAEGGRSVALGYGASAEGGRSVALGYGATSRKAYSMSVGDEASAEGDNSIAMGPGASAEGDSSTALGRDASAGGDGSMSLGRGASAEGNNGIAMGSGASVVGYNGIALGRDASAEGHNSAALGRGASAMGSDEMQLGRSESTVYYYAMAQRSDERDKADIKDTELGLNFINALKPRQFKWDYREDYKPAKPENFNTLSDSAKKAWRESQKLSSITHDGTHKRIREHQGFIAQEVKQVMDELGVDFAGYQDKSITANDEDTKALAMLEFIAPMVKAIQELSARVEALEK